MLYMYGKGNNGMSGLVLSLRYSIGYMVASMALLTHLNYARIQNRRGQYTLPTSLSIQVRGAPATRGTGEGGNGRKGEELGSERGGVHTHTYTHTHITQARTPTRTPIIKRQT